MKNSEFNSQNIALITGASQGIGKGIALYFASIGFNLILITHPDKKNDLEELRNKIKKQCNVDVKNIYFDFSNEKQAKKAVDKIFQSNESNISILVNNAGVLKEGLYSDNQNELMDLMKVNALTHHYITSKAVETMKKNKEGYIINIVSQSGTRARPTLGMYAMTKHAMMGFSDALYQDLMKDGIKVTAICPSVVNTPLAKDSSIPNEEKIEVEDIVKIIGCLRGLSCNSYVKAISIDCRKAYLNKLEGSTMKDDLGKTNQNMQIWTDIVKRYFESHVRQRMAFLNYFLVLVVAMFVSAHTVGKIPGESTLCTGLVVLGVIMIFICLVFWMLDDRVTFLIKHAEAKMKKLESKLGVSDELSLFGSEEIETKQYRKNKCFLTRWLYSYTNCIRAGIVFTAIIYFLYLIFIYINYLNK